MEGLLTRLLSAGDEDVLAVLAQHAPDFGMSDDGRPLRPLSSALAEKYLADPSVLHWVAFDGEKIVGSLVVVVIPRPVSPGHEVLLYEIGVRESHRRRGVGASLVRCMDEWMLQNGVDTAWVLADGDGAEEFYAACGFRADPDQPRYMVRSAVVRGGRSS